MSKLYYINNIDCFRDGETDGIIHIPEEDFPKFIELLEALNKSSRYRYMLCEKHRTATDIYKETTDEYYKLYKSFINSGFTPDQAFELTREWCNSEVARNMADYKHKHYKFHADIDAQRMRKIMSEYKERITKDEQPEKENV